MPFELKQRVRKTKGSSWQGRVVGFYSTTLTPVGYAVESERESGSVQIYPEAALELVPETTKTLPGANCRAMLFMKGLAYPKSSCAICGTFAPAYDQCLSAIKENLK